MKASTHNWEITKPRPIDRCTLCGLSVLPAGTFGFELVGLHKVLCWNCVRDITRAYLLHVLGKDDAKDLEL